MMAKRAGSESQAQPSRRAIEHKKNCEDEELHGNYHDPTGCPTSTVLCAISLGRCKVKLKDTTVSVRKASTMLDEPAVFIRAVSPADEGKLRSMFSRLSLQTVYRRFHTPYLQVPERMAALFTKVDRYRRGVVAVVGNEIVGHAMHVWLEDGNEAEFAIIVEDEWQSKGVGKLLLSEFAEEATRQGTRPSPALCSRKTSGCSVCSTPCLPELDAH